MRGVRREAWVCQVSDPGRQGERSSGERNWEQGRTWGLSLLFRLEPRKQRDCPRVRPGLTTKTPGKPEI